MRRLTTYRQDAVLHSKFRKLDTVLLADWGAVWHVGINPADQPYRISIAYMRGGPIGAYLLRPSLMVSVISPALTRRGTAPDEPVPHVYPEGDLCLYDPGVETDESEWNGAMLIADTIVPWASEWLFFYELWQVTGVWHGREVKH